MPSTNPPSGSPPGWHPDPYGDGRRYWDGTTWTSQTAPAAGRAGRRRGVGLLGPAVAVVAPIVGIVIAAAALIAGRRRDAGLCLAASVAGAICWVLVIRG